MDMIYGLIESETQGLIISKHAYARMKERNGWGRKAAERMVQRVYREGLRPEQIKGYLKGWINKKYGYSNNGDEYVLYGEMLYIFNGRTMLTVIPTPSRSYLIREV